MAVALAHPAGDRRRVTILGATGSIGQSTLDLIGAAPERYEVVALTGHRNVERLAAAALRHRAQLAVIGDPTAYASLKDALDGSEIEVAGGPSGLIEAAARSADWVMSAIVGAAGLEPTLAAVRRGVIIALATKESLICAGALLLNEVRASGAVLLPVDSEHNAIFQALRGERRDSVERLFLTASGGPFRGHSLAQMASVTPSQAIAHPNWTMGAKISVNSATMMNKGLELIEAHHLFGLAAEADRDSRASRIDRAQPGGVSRRLGTCAARAARHAHTDCLHARLARSDLGADPAPRPRGHRSAAFRAPR